jgi:hypothetical protein
LYEPNHAHRRDNDNDNNDNDPENPPRREGSS